jgi:hypothetical protein
VLFLKEFVVMSALAMSDPRAPGVFEDLDLKPVFEKCEEAVLSADTQNFILEFDNVSAKCALDVDLHGMREILATEVE